MSQRRPSRLLAITSAAFIATSIAALAANTTFFTSTGDLVFPFTAPLKNGTAGTIDNMTIGATTPRPGNFTTLASTSPPSGTGNTANFASPPPIGSTAPNTGAFTTGNFTGLAGLNAGAQIDTGTKTAAASSGAATLAKLSGVITTEALTTAGLADYTLTLTNSTIAATDQVVVSIANGTNSAGDPVQGTVTPGTGSVVIVVRNAHATVALNGTLKIAFVVFKN